ncbi:hypothetical protein ABTX85_20770 [Streptomyces sp. NPDC096097]|uniref:hypothetical protein n=1 Tax=Streptomyces sp. NPDC096097 TaxID=3155546 RepID=UPI00331DE59E
MSPEIPNGENSQGARDVSDLAAAHRNEIGQLFNGNGQRPGEVDGSFESKGVDFGKEDCHEGVPDPGAGSWSSFDTGQGVTRVQLKLGTGCFGSLWVGTIDGATVLWRETSPEKREFTSLK